MHGTKTRTEALRLRKEGYSYTHISSVTGLSKSTLSGWLTEIPYTPNASTIAAFGKARAAAGKRRAQMRQQALDVARKEARIEIGNVSRRDVFMFGLGLYLGEGAKTQTTLNIANADPRLLRAAIAWFKSMGAETHQFSARVHLYPDNDIPECISFWSKSLGIPIQQFQKTYVDIRTDKKYKKAGKLPYGTLYLSLRSKGNPKHGVALFRKVQAWNEIVLSSI